ncbi:MAG TPA: bifunctional UDP-N-acetylglucosamine diphosphorylase/glucosamine-1-phosphate N-acetyltransferase GlmU, partial [Caulobacteraceae bacterium]|nr:bifunctional UDP-N-acetylglucosamine diphosphorylase/glucosamine-1-phosphate N-acetyltransferase GlmU [Caulobacteraceae bacterium]
AVILAAGKGERMKSPRAKVMHAVGGRSLLDHAIDTAGQLGCERVVVVVGPHAPEVATHAHDRLGTPGVAVQHPPLGTGHAVLAAKSILAGFAGDIVVTYADVPLLEASAVEPLFDLLGEGADLAVLGFDAADPGAYGRLALGDDGALTRIVEAADASSEELSISLCNSGVMAADAEQLFGLLARVTNYNAKGEYYLTDVVGLGRQDGLTVKVAFADEAEVAGVNSQAELAAAEGMFQDRRCVELMAAGVTMTAPETVHVAWDTIIEAGAVIEPFVVFGPGVRIEAGAVIRAFSHLEGAHVHAGAIVGPYARLRPGAVIGEKAHIGNFVEVKKVRVGAGAKANHLAYLGDGEVGAGANIGAGTIFCNYDGFDKFETFVGAGAFIGSNSALVAPVRIGEGAYTGSGSVITADVAADALALGRGAQVEKPGWAKTFRARKAAEKAKR